MVGIVDLTSVKLHLNMPVSDTTQDTELQGFIDAAGDLARDVVGPILPETRLQAFDGGRPTITVDWLPLASVTSVTEYLGRTAYTLTEQPLGAETDAYSYTVDYDTGQICRRTVGGMPSVFAYGTKNVIVQYVSGDGTVSPSVRLGALELIRHLWQLTQQGGRPQFGGAALDGENGGGVPTGFALPARVIELWQPHRRPPGIA